MSLETLANQLRPILNQINISENICIILSASDLQSQAIVQHACGDNINTVFDNCLSFLRNKLNSLNISPIILKFDIITNIQSIFLNDFVNYLKTIKFGYFRKGIIFDRNYLYVLTEAELNSNNILNDYKINLDNKYFSTRFGSVPILTDTIQIFDSISYFCYNDTIMKIDPNTGYRYILNKSNINLIKRILQSSGDYLLSNIQSNGKFKYLYFPIFDKYKDSYNILRHIGTIWSLIELYKYFKFKNLRSIIFNSIKYFIQNNLIVKTINNVQCNFISSKLNINLGATALAIIVLTEFCQLFKTKKYHFTLSGLINGILYLQNEDGSFNHVIDINDLHVVVPFQTIYYHDEAIFALMKYYKYKDKYNILQKAQLSIDHSIKQNYCVLMDHWASYFINDFIDYNKEDKYIQFGINNFNLHLNTIYNADTIYNVLLELMAISKIMLNKIDDSKYTYNKEFFEKVLVTRAEKQLDGFGWPEIAMFFKQPQKVLNSFYIRHKHFRIRIDDIQHCILGLLTYLKILEMR